MSIANSSESLSESKVVLVMLATGKQGSGVVRALAQINANFPPTSSPPWTILAQTRSASSSKSAALAALPGVHLIEGSPSSPDALFAASPAPVYAVYSVQLGLDNPGGLDAEAREARLLADAAAKHGVRHFIYAGANFGNAPGNRTGVPHLDTKRLGETYLQTTHPTLPTTFLRPVTFMDQLVQDPTTLVGRLTKIMFLCQLAPSTSLQLVAASDVGRVAALAFQNPDKYVGKTVDVVGDELPAAGMESGWREAFASEGIQSEMRPEMTGGSALSWVVKNMTKDLRLMFKFFNEVGYNADLAAAREMYPEMKDWKTFCVRRRRDLPKRSMDNTLHVFLIIIQNPLW